jgi:FMN phosphatase YigB (HAD superfamily)
MKYLALDIGNVLYHCDFDPFLKTLSKQIGISIADAEYFLGRTQKLHDLGYTVMGDELRDHFHIKSEVVVEEILASWNDSVKPNISILTHLDDLQFNKKIKIALLSNIGLEHAANVNEVLEHNNILEDTIKHFSCFVGARKPSALFYQSFLMQYPEFKGALYIDDVAENLKMGQHFGFDSQQFNLLVDSPAVLFHKIDCLLK